MQNDQLSVLYAVGPGDVVSGYRTWLQGLDVSYEMSVPFSYTFLDWCERSKAHTHLISSYSKREYICDGRYIIENRPRPNLYWGSGMKYHIGSAGYGLSILGTALRERPKVLIVDSGTTHWIVLALAAAARIPVVAVMHSTLWPAGFPPTRKSDRILRKLDGMFFRHFGAATLCVSPECERQVRAVAQMPNGPILQCRAQFRQGFLDKVDPVPPHGEDPFRVLFVGRIEENKGVFLILSIAEELERQATGRFKWRIIGSGSALEELRGRAEVCKLANVVEIAGRLPREDVQSAYGWAHAMIVPTTSGYSEGLAMTAAEAVLAGRPVVLSTVVPAWEVLGEAAIRVPPDDVVGFVDAFRKLAQDQAFYDRCRAATAAVQGQFYDSSLSVGSVLGRVISNLNYSI
jgi:glycogen synthase